MPREVTASDTGFGDSISNGVTVLHTSNEGMCFNNTTMPQQAELVQQQKAATDATHMPVVQFPCWYVLSKAAHGLSAT